MQIGFSKFEKVRENGGPQKLFAFGAIASSFTFLAHLAKMHNLLNAWHESLWYFAGFMLPCTGMSVLYVAGKVARQVWLRRRHF